MSIVRRDFPTATAPSSVTDYQRQNTLLDKLMMKSQQIWHYGGSYYLPKGLVFYHGGTVYEVTADEAISGSFSKYITVTKSVDGSTCTAAFVAVMTGITWNDSYNGYYDASGNLVFVDEFELANAGTIAAPKGLLGWLGKILLDAIDLNLAGRLIIGSGGFELRGNPGGVYASLLRSSYIAAETGRFRVTDLSIPERHYLEVLASSNRVSVLGSLFVGADINPTTAPTSGSQALGAGADWTPARGVYVISCPAGIRVKTSGSTSAADFNGGTLFADGTKVKLTNSTGGSLTVYYEKF